MTNKSIDFKNFSVQRDKKTQIVILGLNGGFPCIIRLVLSGCLTSKINIDFHLKTVKRRVNRGCCHRTSNVSDRLTT